MQIRDLNDEEKSALTSGLLLAAKLAQADGPLTIEQVQAIYDVIAKDPKSFPEAVIAVGLAFGQTIVSEGNYEWVRVEDQYGSETVLSPNGYSLILSPISMIQKRMDDGESVDLSELREQATSVIVHKIENGELKER